MVVSTSHTYTHFPRKYSRTSLSFSTNKFWTMKNIEGGVNILMKRLLCPFGSEWQGKIFTKRVLIILRFLNMKFPPAPSKTNFKSRKPTEINEFKWIYYRCQSPPTPRIANHAFQEWMFREQLPPSSRDGFLENVRKIKRLSSSELTSKLCTRNEIEGVNECVDETLNFFLLNLNV